MMLGSFSRKHLHLQPRVRPYRESTASSRSSCDAVALVVVAALPCRVPCRAVCVCVVGGGTAPLVRLYQRTCTGSFFIHTCGYGCGVLATAANARVLHDTGSAGVCVGVMCASVHALPAVGASA